MSLPIPLTTWRAVAGLASGLVLGLTPVMAENRALIIGIGQSYHGKVKPILGPGQDVVLATELAARLGFQPHQRRILREGEATKQAILRELAWLQDGVHAGDTALIYYSGHGTRLPTPSQACTAALAPVDFTGTEINLLLQAAEFNRFLEPLRQRATVIVLLDACFSGGLTRSRTDAAPQMVKYHALDKGASACDQAINDPQLIQAPLAEHRTALSQAGHEALADRLVALTATAANELAFGDLTRSGKGSLFTQAIADLVLRPGQTPPLTFAALRDHATARIGDVSRAYKHLPHTPQLLGNPALFTHPLSLDPRREPVERGASLDEERELPALLRSLVRASTFPVALDAPETRIALGKATHLTFTSSKPGYVHILAIEPDGVVTQIFPNVYQLAHAVSAQQRVRIDILAKPPIGPSRFVALVTATPLALPTQDGRHTSKSAPPLTPTVRGEFGAAEVVLEVVAAP